jgi:hypothetical protein
LELESVEQAEDEHGEEVLASAEQDTMEFDDNDEVEVSQLEM